MELTIRTLNTEDYDTILCKWWADWKWVAPTRDFLPNNGEGGMIVYDGEEPICAGFLYVTNSKVAWVDWIVSSKTYRKKPQRQEAILFLVDSLTELARVTDNEYTYALVKHGGLIETYEKLGYTKADTYTSEMIKKL